LQIFIEINLMWGFLACILNFLCFEEYHSDFCGTHLLLFHTDPIPLTLIAENYFHCEFKNKVAGFPHQGKCLYVSP